MIEFVTIRFTTPVKGADPFDGETFLADRHRLEAVWARQDRHETLFVDDSGEVVARWDTHLIDRIEWPDASSQPDDRDSPRVGVGTKAWRDQVQDEFPNAYQRWSTVEEERLLEGLEDGLTVDQLAHRHHRRPGGIMARLVRLGVIQRNTPMSAVGQEPTDAPAGEPIARVTEHPQAHQEMRSPDLTDKADL